MKTTHLKSTLEHSPSKRIFAALGVAVILGTVSAAHAEEAAAPAAATEAKPTAGELATTTGHDAAGAVTGTATTGVDAANTAGAVKDAATGTKAE
jgi:hypothetical protein